MIQLGYGILALAAINFALTASGGVKFLLCYRDSNRCTWLWNMSTVSMIRETYATSIWFLILAVSVRISFFTDNIVIGYFRSTGEVAVYSIAVRLAQYALVAVAAFNVVLMPVSAGYDAQADLASSGVAAWHTGILCGGHLHGHDLPRLRRTNHPHLGGIRVRKGRDSSGDLSHSR